MNGKQIGFWIVPLMFFLAGALSLASGDELGGIPLVLTYGNDSVALGVVDGVTDSSGVLDFSVAQTVLAPELDAANLCTLWTIMPSDGSSISECFGSEACCTFNDLTVTRPDWQ